MEVPESLRALVDVGILDEAGLESTMMQMTEEELDALQGGQVPEWLQELMEEESAEAVAVEEVEEDLVAAVEPPFAEIPGAEIAFEEDELPQWLQEAVEPEPEEVLEAIVVEELEEEPVAELPVAEIAFEEEEMPEAPQDAVEPEPEEVAEPAAEEKEEALAPTRAIPVLVDAPAEDVPVAEEVAPPSRVAELLAQLGDKPRDYKARLELARLFCAEAEWDAAMDHYQKLVSARKLLPAVIDDLTPLAGESVDRARLYQLLGDAFMEDDRLDDALGMYRKAKQELMQR
jgi:hypothetical protein